MNKFHKSFIMTVALLMQAIFNVNYAHARQKPFADADWITISYPEPVTGKRVCPVFMKTFTLNGKKIKSAKLFISALGLYEAKINGVRVGQDYFTPGFTNYNKRLQYQKYDVTRLITNKSDHKNQIEILVGEGWYRGVFRAGPNDQSRNNYGDQAGLLAELVLEYKSDSKAGKENRTASAERIVSDTSWKCAESGIRYSELYDGELYDAGFMSKDWKNVKLLHHSKTILIPPEAEPVRKQESFEPMAVLNTPKGEQVVDFGQNMAGWVQLRVKGKKGDTVKVAHAEMLDKEGNFFTENLRSAKAEDIYILKGEREEILEPHFTYHGFRYAKISGFKAGRENCRAIALYTDLKKTGTFECSDPMLTRLQKNIEWSLNSNFFDIPTDCPQRSERMGWGGDAQIFSLTASYLRDTRKFYKKWMADLSTEQKANGAVPVYWPTALPADVPMNGAAGWSDAATVIPWTVYQIYKDTTILKAQYTCMKAWVDFVNTQSPDGLWKANGYGDWYAQGEATSLPFIDQCYWAYSTQILIDAAKILGRSENVSTYSKLLSQIKTAFLQNYGNFNSGPTTTQTAYILALQFDLLPEAQRAGIAAKLAEKVKTNNNHLATGVLGTPFLLHVLSRFGYHDLAYSLLMQRGFPSWLYPVTKGATTIWEKWDAVQEDGTVQPTSFNHYAYGAVGGWMYERIGGIRPAAPGYEKVIIEPIPGGGLTWAKSSYLSDYGRISCSWKLKDGKMAVNVEIPKGVTAEIRMAGKIPENVEFGKYVFK